MIRVLFISHSKRGAFYYNDASARYRCIFPAEHFNDTGIKTHVIHFSQIKAIKATDYSHIIFHRPQYSLKLKHFLQMISRLGIQAIADFDDLLINPQLAEKSAAVQAGYMHLKLAKKQANAYAKALRMFSYCWVSTTELAKQVEACFPNMKIATCYNKLPLRWARLQPITPWQDKLKHKVIRYMPGTSHHKHDFEKIETWLAELLHRDPDIQLDVVGDLQFDTKKFPPAQISQQNHMTFEQLPSAINTSWLTLAPLQSNVFNQCKSGLKFWESGLYGVPVISSALEDINRFKNSGLCISNHLTDWSNFIEKMKQPAAYQDANQQALISAKTAIFSKKQTEKRLDELRIKNIDTREATESTKVNYGKQQLIMCANIGPRWPGILLDPTHPHNQQAQTLIAQHGQFNDRLTQTDIQQLQAMAMLKTKMDVPKRKSVIKRKLNKLRKSPYAFFKDIKF